MNKSLNETSEIYDVIGIGIGPFNLGLAALLDPVSDVKALFLEKKASFNWHPGMLIEGTTLQVPFFADLVSMADVRSDYSFLRYLEAHNRLYHFYFLEKFHIPRKEYNHYCQWVSSQLANCQYEMDVQSVTAYRLDSGEEVYQVKSLNGISQKEETLLTRHIVVGIGSVPSVPQAFQHELGKSIFHTADYLSNKDMIKEAGSIAVIGSGQSAAEVFLDVAKEQEQYDFSLQWFTRAKGFFPMEYSKLGLEYFSPDYTAFFYGLPQEKKDQLLKQQDLLYKGISAETIADIYDHLYERSIGGEYADVVLQPMTEITGVKNDGGTWELQGYHQLQEEEIRSKADLVILGTGYKMAFPSFLSPMKEWIRWDDLGRYKVTEDYRVEMLTAHTNRIFVQNGDLHTHGVGTPDLGLGAHRNAMIINAIIGREVYSVHSRNVYQNFGQKTGSNNTNQGKKGSYAVSK
ncbi:lysine 6-monooxygenase [Jeotgalibacillus sp. S-D1]|uniref:lysine N(6)-hydroxylase/L-ornithine N(5)-oxygenase family protein n=1 Tax=Jeotgalibacillus sp. S-D1 TaxID=2552189 RepID=UPI001059D9AD|nr:lysine N(6)-hydroxylase/L-ornithine N(5)-oxygenase family protein [Jeotgalibacillus sp. S-D1]TDL34185.1 lysine 6-monooxygenase [Jeotgalibacillus sp. S-D1]